MVNLYSVESSMIAAAGYDPRPSVLVVLYNSGRAYEYHEVPPEIFWGLMAARSKGQFMNRYILGVFPYKVFRGWNRLEEDDLQFKRPENRARSRPERRIPVR